MRKPRRKRQYFTSPVTGLRTPLRRRLGHYRFIITRDIADKLALWLTEPTSPQAEIWLDEGNQQYSSLIIAIR